MPESGNGREHEHNQESPTRGLSRESPSRVPPNAAGGRAAFLR
jgi:hypothetical protein